MLKKKFRLRKDIAFSATYRLKNCRSNDFLIIYKGKSKTSETVPTKIGIVVSKKIHKRAVKRNKIKRRIREIYLEELKNNRIANLQEAISIVFVAKSSILDVDFLTLKKSIQELIQKF